MKDRYRDRKEAGEKLSEYLDHYIGAPDLLVLALPRGGIVVAQEIAQALKARLDVFLVRKLGAPGEPELAMGAVAEGGIVELNNSVVDFLSISKEDIEKTAESELSMLRQRQHVYRGKNPQIPIAGKSVIIVDDGLATGATMKVALKAVKKQNPERVAVAVPVGAPATVREIRVEADDMICPLQPDHFMAVGVWYENFDQVSDDEVTAILQKYRESSG
ncbi:Phosphoribosyl transferase domain protein [Chitinispirillum alkaliphilum]|nr:Phosphoribosyl transferase domain protein [Chitinispirillum alkaliphilum]